MKHQLSLNETLTNHEGDENPKTYELQQDEYLLKIGYSSMGFLTKKTQKGEIPKRFLDWHGVQIQIYVVKQDFYNGWKIHNYRDVTSECWMKVVHPVGYILEIKMKHFIELMLEGSIIEGELQGKYKWVNGELIKKK